MIFWKCPECDYEFGPVHPSLNVKFVDHRCKHTHITVESEEVDDGGEAAAQKAVAAR